MSRHPQRLAKYDAVTIPGSKLLGTMSLTWGTPAIATLDAAESDSLVSNRWMIFKSSLGQLHGRPQRLAPETGSSEIGSLRGISFQ